MFSKLFSPLPVVVATAIWLTAATGTSPAFAQSPPGISISHVDGMIAPGEIATSNPVTFHIRYHNTTDSAIMGATNGIKVYSPDGAQWDTTYGQHTGLFTPYWDDGGIFIQPFSVDGSGIDTIGFGGFAIFDPGVPGGFDDVPFTLTVGPIDEMYEGYQLCLDSTFYPPGGRWVWSFRNEPYEIVPDWGGPYCYTIRKPLTWIAVTPDTLVFYGISGFMDPPAQTLHVYDEGGNFLSYTAGESATWLDIGPTSGTTPDDITVAVTTAGLDPGTYFADIIVSSPEAPNGFTTAVVKLIFDEVPPGAAIILNDVEPINTLGQIPTGVPVTFNLRLINNTSKNIHGTTNGFSISSAGGATWSASVGDTIGSIGQDMFDGGLWINYFSADGAGVDTVGFGALAIFSTGLPAGFNDVAYSLTIGPIDSSYAGQTICLDTCFYPPSGYWLWADDLGTEFVPFWSGRICFTLANFSPTDPEDSLLIPSQSIYSGLNVQPVVIKAVQPLKGATIPIAIPDGIEVTSLSTAGLVTENWDYTILDVKPDSGFAFMALANTQGLTIPAGETNVCNIHFRAASNSCTESHFWHWDTTLYHDPSRRLTFVGTDLLPIEPGFDVFRDQVELLPFLPGDCNGDGTVSIADLTYMIAFMFRGGPLPFAINTMDINGDCRGPDIADLVALIEYLFQAGPPPQCGCIGSAAGKAYPPADVSVFSEFVDGMTVVSLTSAIDLRGIELTLTGNNAAEPVALVGENLDLLSGYRDGTLRVGLVDLEGVTVLPAGEHRLVQVEGHFEVTSALVADNEANALAPSLTAPSGLPRDYQLDQNFPNPFNPTTTISFSLPQASEVTLEIFNIAGQKTTTLINQRMEAGTHTCEWNGADAASGVYLYRLTAGDFCQAKKMLLLK